MPYLDIPEQAAIIGLVWKQTGGKGFYRHRQNVRTGRRGKCRKISNSEWFVFQGYTARFNASTIAFRSSNKSLHYF
ncbi:hypothetical protein SerAS12_4260 [Serratia sp. AS12]|nr:hypothetical protein SerAS9_4259 [Serratia plymuthica AS9]AEF52307.1 hypothetical protein SerAS12_4260 [Serratia sp. AS12]AEG30014.1 hypothetical protein SerAS13_4260 [Serratia sp. AS13]